MKNPNGNDDGMSLRWSIEEKYSRLSPTDREKVIIFIELMQGCPEFWFEYKNSIPDGMGCPPLKVVDTLINKYSRTLTKS